MKKLNCYIYGAGHLYNRLLCIIRQIKEIHILGVVTTGMPQSKFIDGFHCYSVKAADFSVADYVIIAVENWIEIYNNLCDCGVNKEKIILGKVFELPYFDLTEYLRLKGRMPSIISNTCLGGRVYKELGLEMLTPCINAICFCDEQFIDFITNLKEYIKKDLKPCKNDGTQYVKGSYNRESFIPKATVSNGVIWNFPHDDIETAVQNWNRRKNRLNDSNLSYLMVIFSDDGAVAFEQFEAERKLGFYYKDLGLKSVLYTPEWNDIEVQRKFDYNYVMFVHRYATHIEGLGRINWLKFLQGEDMYLRW